MMYDNQEKMVTASYGTMMGFALAPPIQKSQLGFNMIGGAN
jgi:hypothetical protein